MPIDLKIKTEKKSENPETQKTFDEIIKIKPICSKACRICGSGLIGEIHEMRKAGAEYLVILAALEKKHNFKTSKSSLSNHFQNWQKRQALISAEIVSNELIDEVAKRATHTREVIGLIDAALLQLKQRAAVGWIFDVSDLEKLINIKYKVLNGEPSGESDLVAMFQKASDKYGMTTTQATLFKNTK